MSGITGIHHVTAIGSDPGRTIAFYAGVLGLRLVKRSVNQEDPTTWHLFFGNAHGDPGTAMTVIAWPEGRGGRVGAGQVAEVAFAVRPDAIGFWVDRFVRRGVAFDPPIARPTGMAGRTETVLAFRDPDGLRLALVVAPGAPDDRAWDGHDEIPLDAALRGFHSVTIWVSRAPATTDLLTEALGAAIVGQDGTTTRLAFGDGRSGQIVSVREIGNFAEAVEGTGTTHHVAWSVADGTGLEPVSVALTAAGTEPTLPINRYYFRSLYVREPGGTLFEVATAGPGLTIDEPADYIGEQLTLPPEFEPDRDRITAALAPITSHQPTSSADIAARLLARFDQSTDLPTGPSAESSAEESPMTTTDTFHYRFDPAGSTAPADLTLLLLHGTGGDEDSLVPLGQVLAPGTALISPRGNVSEQGAPRFFRRHAEGVLDQVDLAARTDELADWLPVVAAEHAIDLAGLVAVGFSNGANIAASVLFRRPDALRAAILLSPMLPFEPETLPDLSGVGVFIGAGQLDPLVPTAQVDRLAELYRAAGADVTVHWEAGGHQITMPEVEATRAWLAALPAIDRS